MQTNPTYIAQQQTFLDSTLNSSKATYNLVVGHYPIFGTATQYGKDSGAYPGNYNSWATVSLVRLIPPLAQCRLVNSARLLVTNTCSALNLPGVQCCVGVQLTASFVIEMPQFATMTELGLKISKG